jgi:hypothetical protein
MAPRLARRDRPLLKLLALIALVLVLAGCGGHVTPCVNEDLDPTGICANSHGEVR